MPAIGTTRYPQLHDRRWLADRLAAGVSADGIAAELGCGGTTVRKALRGFGLESNGRYAEPVPTREFLPLASRLELADLDADVAADELARRLAEGLEDLGELVRLAGELPRERLWGLVVDQVDAATARAAVFAAAAVAAKQAS